MDDVSADRFGQCLGRLVREAREAVGMTQVAVEREAALPGATLAKMERGEMWDLPVHDLVRVAEVLNVDLTALLPPREQ